MEINIHSGKDIGGKTSMVPQGEPEDKTIPSVLQDTEPKSPPQPASLLRRLWPWAWFGLVGVVTLGWLIGLGWAAVAFFQWLVG